MAAYREPMNVEERAPTAAQVPHSPWHSPVPYLFGGLAAMLGLIAFALLILACSYWKLSGYLEDNGDRDLEAGESKSGEDQKQQQPPYEEKILVIMAGQDKPTFLATPATNTTTTTTTTTRSSTFGNNAGGTCTCNQAEKSQPHEAAKDGNGPGGDTETTRDASSDQSR